MKMGRKSDFSSPISPVCSVLAMKATRVIGSCWCIKPDIHTMPIWLYQHASARLHHANHGINAKHLEHSNKRPVNVYRPLLTYTRRIYSLWCLRWCFGAASSCGCVNAPKLGIWNMGSLSGKAEAPMRRKMMLVLPRKLRSFGFSLK